MGNTSCTECGANEHAKLSGQRLCCVSVPSPTAVRPLRVPCPPHTITEVFDKYDTNQSGTIDVAELGGMLRDAYGVFMSPTHAAVILKVGRAAAHGRRHSGKDSSSCCHQARAPASVLPQGCDGGRGRHTQLNRCSTFHAIHTILPFRHPTAHDTRRRAIDGGTRHERWRA